MTILRLPLMAMFVVGCAQAADPSCRAMLDAGEKLSTTPYHMYMSTTADYDHGKTKTAESIYANKTMYVLVGGKWIVSPMTEQDRQEARKNAEKSAGLNATCRLVRDESVNGEAATLYSAHTQTAEHRSDTLSWISKTRGLPLKQEVDMDVGGSAGKSHRTARYDFTNVQAPAGVH
jgi:hypothetical protein